MTGLRFLPGILAQQGGSDWTPLDLPDLLAFYDPSDPSGVTATGSLVDSLNDLSGNGLHLTASGSERPTTGSAAFNGNNVLTFGGSQILKASSGADWRAFSRSGYGPGSVYVACRPAAGLNGDLGFIMSTREDGFHLAFDDRGGSADRINAGYLFVDGNGGTRAPVFAGSMMTIGVINYIEAEVDADQATMANRAGLRINGGIPVDATGTGSGAAITDPQPLWVGDSPHSSSFPWVGDIGPIVMTESNVTGDDLDNLRAWFSSKWAATVPS